MSDPATPDKGFTLRQLPLPAKLVVTVFLLSVGLGYLSAMVQLHFQHASKGSHLPGAADVVAKFSGVILEDWWKGDKDDNGAPAAQAAPPPPPPAVVKDAPAPTPVAKAAAGGPMIVKVKSIIDTRCVRCHGPEGKQEDFPLHDYASIKEYLKVEDGEDKCQLEALLIAEESQSWNGTGQMREAFTRKSADWEDVIAERPADEVRHEREGERLALLEWIRSPEAVRAKAYDDDRFVVAKWPAGHGITPILRHQDSALAVKSAPGEKPPASAATPTTAPNGNGKPAKRSAKSKMMSVTSLTQSTHVHMLGFSMLYALTGIIFAFTSYPLWLRATVAPLVLVAQAVDISCWWLARLDGVGPYFAMTIIGTGLVVGLGLFVHIVGSVWDLYGACGKTVLGVLFLIGAIGAWEVKQYVIDPHMAGERKEVEDAKPKEEPKPAPAAIVKPAEAPKAPAVTEKKAEAAPAAPKVVAAAPVKPETKAAAKKPEPKPAVVKKPEPKPPAMPKAVDDKPAAPKEMPKAK
jgi:hypothetical protein